MNWAAISFLSLATCALPFSAVAFLVTRRLLTRSTVPIAEGRCPAIVILRPCEGDEPELAERLESGFRIRWPSKVHHVVAVGRALPALAETTCLRHGATIVRSGALPPDINRKAFHLSQGLRVAAADAPIVLAIDADVEVTDRLIECLVAGLSDAHVAATFAPPIQSGTLAASRIGRATLGGSLHAFPTITALAEAVGSLAPMVGCAVAFRRDALNGAGGFSTALHVIGDDLAMASALAPSGRVSIVGCVADCRDETKTVVGIASQLARWIRVVVSHRPLLAIAYPLVMAPLIPLAAFGLAAAPSLGWGPVLGTVLCVYVLRAAHAYLLRERLFGRPHESLGDPWLADAAWWACLAIACLPTRTRWRGRRYRIGRAGRLEAEGTPS